MKSELVYVELKTGFSDSGPAWVGISGASKSGATIYFNGCSFKSLKGSGISGNYYELGSGDEYWISGVKKNNQDRHWSGNGKIQIDRKAISKYLKHLNISSLPGNFEPTDLEESKYNKMLHEIENETLISEQELALGRRPIKQKINRLQS